MTSLALLASLLWGGADFVAGTATKRLHPLASTRGQVGVAVVLSSLFPVVTAILARIVHDERLRPVQVAGVADAVVGVVLIAVG